jgi:hypothetical protein
MRNSRHILGIDWKSSMLVLLAGAMLMGTVASCAGDPRKNCNHPQHGAYMREQQKKKMRF